MVRAPIVVVLVNCLTLAYSYFLDHDLRGQVLCESCDGSYMFAIQGARVTISCNGKTRDMHTSTDNLGYFTEYFRMKPDSKCNVTVSKLPFNCDMPRHTPVLGDEFPHHFGRWNMDPFVFKSSTCNTHDPHHDHKTHHGTPAAHYGPPARPHSPPPPPAIDPLCSILQNLHTRRDKQVVPAPLVLNHYGNETNVIHIHIIGEVQCECCTDGMSVGLSDVQVKLDCGETKAYTLTVRGEYLFHVAFFKAHTCYLSLNFHTLPKDTCRGTSDYSDGYLAEDVVKQEPRGRMLLFHHSFVLKQEVCTVLPPPVQQPALSPVEP